MGCLKLLKYPFQCQARVGSDVVADILRPFLTYITIYTNIQFQTKETFLMELAKQLNNNGTPAPIVSQFFQLPRLDVALLAHQAKSKTSITKALEAEIRMKSISFRMPYGTIGVACLEALLLILTWSGQTITQRRSKRSYAAS
jgi:hypothetical protein